MRPVIEGDRGPAVEDVQRRLLALEYDLGPTGVDGVFMGRTLDAVRAFQAEHGLSEDGVVGAGTWAALVDATFTLGDRLLYLRFPYLHGRDVRTLQGVLNALGFSCGDRDGIFGPFTERAVREFQLSMGHPADGIVGSETVAQLERLRHVWEGKSTRAPSAGGAAPSRPHGALDGRGILLRVHDEAGREVADRATNLLLAASSTAEVETVDEGGAGGEARAGGEGRHRDARILLGAYGGSAPGEVPFVASAEDTAAEDTAGEDTAAEALARRLATALRAADEGETVVLDVTGAIDERSAQRVAVALVDGLSEAL